MDWIDGYFVLLGIVACACVALGLVLLLRRPRRRTHIVSLLSVTALVALFVALLVGGWIWAQHHLTG
jgi:hypothetical protein